MTPRFWQKVKSAWKKPASHNRLPRVEPLALPQPSISPKSGESRVIRVFVSSTFHDMQDERDHLVKVIFPELRRRCRDRAVEFVEVDLRWGMTEEQAERGELLPICLAEIENCRPYFIALLGERYGYVPERIDPELERTQRWLAEHREHSITALEILHGALNNPQMAKRASFYFRDPSYLERIPHRRALAIREKALGPEHPSTALSLNNLALTLRDKGAYSDAEAHFRCGQPRSRLPGVQCA
jgi:hypothetical protein